MKTIQIKLMFNTFRTRSDDALGFSGITARELTNEEKAELMAYAKVEVDALLKPVGVGMPELLEVKTDLGQKTQSQRLRSVLYLLWEKEGKQGTPDEFYYKYTEKMIEWVKEKLND